MTKSLTPQCMSACRMLVEMDPQIHATPAPLTLAMSTKEAARLLSVSHRTMEDWRLSGQGPPFRKWGRLVRYHMNDLKSFADSPSFANTGEAHAA